MCHLFNWRLMNFSSTAPAYHSHSSTVPGLRRALNICSCSAFLISTAHSVLSTIIYNPLHVTSEAINEGPSWLSELANWANWMTEWLQKPQLSNVLGSLDKAVWCLCEWLLIPVLLSTFMLGSIGSGGYGCIEGRVYLPIEGLEKLSYWMFAPVCL